MGSDIDQHVNHNTMACLAQVHGLYVFESLVIKCVGNHCGSMRSPLFPDSIVCWLTKQQICRCADGVLTVSTGAGCHSLAPIQ